MEKRLIALKSEIEQTFDMFSEAHGYLTLTAFNFGGEEVDLEEELRKIFHEYCDVVPVVQIETETIFESPGYTCGIISVAFVNQITGLETYLEKWEEM
jgi:hypothetical protein